MKRKRSSALTISLAVLMLSAGLKAQAAAQAPQDQVQRENMLRELERLLNVRARGEQGGLSLGLSFQRGGGGQRSADPSRVVRSAANPGAWWMDPATVQRLGLTDDQKAKIDRAFENHRQRMISTTAQLEKEEAQLSRLLETDPLDRGAILTQIDRVVQARGEVELVNSAMTLEMREYLTRAQWTQLTSPPQRVRVGAAVAAANLISQIPPAYPESARQAGIQGPVTLEVEISREGTVESVRAVAGEPQLLQAAMEAVKQWRYRPVLLNGEAVPVITAVTLGFPFSNTPAAGAGQRQGGGGRGGPGGRGVRGQQ